MREKLRRDLNTVRADLPLGQQCFGVAQLGLPRLPPIGAPAARHQQFDEVNEPEMRVHTCTLLLVAQRL